MNPEPHRPTEPFVDESLMLASDFQRVAHIPDLRDPQVYRGVRLTTLSPSLLADLDRFDRRPEGADPLEVLAACVRHARPLVVFLEIAGRVLPLRLFPSAGLYACPADLPGLPEAHLRLLRVARVEPGMAYKAASAVDAGAASERTGALALLSWQIAMRGRRFELLPEITGRACYRVSRSLSLDGLPIDDAAADLLRRMRQDRLALDDMAALPGIGFQRACRLLNAVYLQAGLITLRVSPGSRQPRGRPDAPVAVA